MTFRNLDATSPGRAGTGASPPPAGRPWRFGLPLRLALFGAALLVLAPSPAQAADPSATSLAVSPGPSRMDQAVTLTARIGLAFDGSGAAAARIDGGGSHACAITPAGGAMCWGLNAYGQLGDGTKIDRLVPVAVKGPGNQPLAGVVAVAAGGSHSCALLAGGAVFCWGLNTLGQIGVGSAGGEYPVAVQVPGISGATAVVAGAWHSCARLGTGALACWGRNAYGQLGLGFDSDWVASPGEVKGPGGAGGLMDVTAVAAGAEHTCALALGGQVFCWGSNGSGQTGTGAGDTILAPEPVLGADTLAGASALAAAAWSTCAIVAEGKVACWGANSFGQVGQGMTSSSEPTPRLVTGVGGSGTIAGAVSITSGWRHTCALLADGATACWGGNGNGELGSGTTVNAASPVAVPAAPGPVAAIAAGDSFTCRLSQAGTAECWGDNRYGQLGRGFAGIGRAPVAVVSGGAAMSAQSLAAGGDSSCAVTGGALACWGDNYSGELGIGTKGPPVPSPTAVLAGEGLAFGLTGVEQAAMGWRHGCARLSSGAVRCWGNNERAELGTGPVGGSTAPVEIGLPGTPTWISAGGSHSCAVLDTGDAVCWGYNAGGQLGSGQTSESEPVPVAVTDTDANGNLSGIEKITAGGFHTCAVLSGGEVACWGVNSQGQTGASAQDLDVPAMVPGFGGVQKKATGIALGFEHSCATVDGGSAWCWGSNSSGQLGNGVAAGSDMPVAVKSANGLPLTAVTAITAGFWHTCAISDGVVHCWGDNYLGQLGDGTAVDSPVAIPVMTATGPLQATAIAAGDDHTCALRPDTTVVCWGDGANGQLGDGRIGYETLAGMVGPKATGTVTFTDGARTLGTDDVAGGVAVLEAKDLQAGRRVLKAVYAGDATLAASTSETVSHLVTGTLGADRLRGGGGADELMGIDGRDVILGRRGNDVLDGGGGNDRIEGGPGSDRLTGGPGRDVFAYRNANESRPGKARRDVIADFDGARDRIDLSRVDADATRPGRQPFRFIGGRPFSGTPGELRFTRGLLAGDTDGDRRAEFQVRVIAKGAKLGARSLKLK